ncbi:MAG: hypothetical protein ABWY04_18730, partial [Arthrobacter sp.]
LGIDLGIGGGNGGTETPGNEDPSTENPDSGTGGNGTVDPGTGGNPSTDNSGTDGNGTTDDATVTGSGNGGTFAAAARSTAVGGVIGTDSSHRSTTGQGSALANTGTDISLVPFALLLLGAGIFLLRKRRIS